MPRLPRPLPFRALPCLIAGLFLGLLLTAAPARAADWPQWRGPDRDGQAPDGNLLQEWPADGPRLLWRSRGLGRGFSSLAVAGERIYTMGDLETGLAEGEEAGQYVIAASREDGRILWRTRVGPRWEDEYGGPRSTPTVDGEMLYALGTQGDLVCLQAATGKEVWRRHLPRDFGGRMMEIEGTDWRFAESPLVDGKHLIATPGGPEAGLVALDKTTGEEIWRAKIPQLGEAGADGAAYSSAVLTEAAGRRQVIQLMGRGLVGVDADTGEFLWGYNRVANHVANIPTPLVRGDQVFTSTGYGTGAALLKLEAEAEGDGVTAREVYFLPGDTFQNHHGGMVLHGDHVYAGSGHNRGFPLALEMSSGEVAWGPVRNEGRGSAAIALADGLLFLRYQNGLMVLAEASPEEYREKGAFEIPDAESFSWAHPVVADGKLYLREQDHLLVYDLVEAPAPKPAEPPAEGAGSETSEASETARR